MINWAFIPTWTVMVLLFVAIGWIIWNFDQEVEDLEHEIDILRNKLISMEEED